MIRRRARTDPVTPEVREKVLRRDAYCFMLRIDPDHECRDQWGQPHTPYDWWSLSIEHVKKHLRMGLRAPSKPPFLLAMCHGANVGVPSKAVREAERAYLAALYPEAWA